MKTIGFSIFDSKAEVYGPPFFAPAIGLAVRHFGDLCRDPNSALSKHPGDYRLFRIGEFDDSTGVVGMGDIVAPVLLATGDQEAGQ